MSESVKTGAAGMNEAMGAVTPNAGQGSAGAPRERTEPFGSAPAASVLRGPDGRFLRGSGKPARRRRGAQPGNLNGCKYPWRTLWRRGLGLLRPEDEWLRPLLADYSASLVADRGGPEAMTAGEARMIELATLSRGCTMLVLAEAAKAGGIVAKRRSASIVQSATVTQRFADPDLAAALARFMQVESAAPACHRP